MIAAHSSVILAPNGRPAILEAIENNWYEASRWSPNRSWIWFPVQDAKRDLDRFTRYELVKGSRYLWKNSPFIRGVIEGLVNLVIGDGLRAVPMSENKNFRAQAKASWQQFCKTPCVDSRMRMSNYMRVKTRERFLDGEGFTLKTWSRKSGRNRIQGFETDTVTGSSTDSGDLNQNTLPDSSRWHDGIFTDEQGRPVSYKFRNVQTPIPAENVIHHFTRLRSGQMKGEPILSSAQNHARDVDDILALEKQAVKEASGHKDIIETSSGEYDPDGMRKAAFGQTNFPTTLALLSDPKDRTDWYKVQFQGQPIILRRGDKYNPYKPDRPGQAWQGFIDFLSYTICLSTGLPPSILLPVDVGGTDVRRDLERAQRVIEPWQGDIADEFQEIWEYYIQGEIDDGWITEQPEDWNNVRWYFPRSITVDRGRDAAQDREDVSRGLMSRQEFHGRYGDDSEEYEDIIFAEAKRRRDLIKKAGFESVREFVEVISLDPKAFQKPQTPDREPALAQ